MLGNKTSLYSRPSVVFKSNQVFLVTLPKHTSKANTQNPSKQVKTP